MSLSALLVLDQYIQGLQPAAHLALFCKVAQAALETKQTEPDFSRLVQHSIMGVGDPEVQYVAWSRLFRWLCCIPFAKNPLFLHIFALNCFHISVHPFSNFCTSHDIWVLIYIIPWEGFHVCKNWDVGELWRNFAFDERPMNHLHDACICIHKSSCTKIHNKPAWQTLAPWPPFKSHSLVQDLKLELLWCYHHLFLLGEPAHSPGSILIRSID